MLIIARIIAHEYIYWVNENLWGYPYLQWLCKIHADISFIFWIKNIIKGKVMMQKLNQYIKSSGGVFNAFCQADLLNKNNWWGTRYEDRSGAWVGNSGHKNAEGQVVYGLSGACYGLSCAYLIKGAQWSDFEPYINTRAGHSVILGIMNYQKQHTAILRAVKRSTTLNERYKKRMPTNKEAAEIVMKTNADIVFYNSQQIRSIVSPEVRAKILIDKLKPGYCYEISFFSTQARHSVAAWVENNVIKYFDSNYGEITYPNNKAGLNSLKAALGMMFADSYKNFNEVTIRSYNWRATA